MKFINKKDFLLHQKYKGYDKKSGGRHRITFGGVVPVPYP